MQYLLLIQTLWTEWPHHISNLKVQVFNIDSSLPNGLLQYTETFKNWPREWFWSVNIWQCRPHRKGNFCGRNLASVWPLASEAVQKLFMVFPSSLCVISFFLWSSFCFIWLFFCIRNASSFRSGRNSRNQKIHPTGAEHSIVLAITLLLDSGSFCNGKDLIDRRSLKVKTMCRRRDNARFKDRAMVLHQ